MLETRRPQEGLELKVDGRRRSHTYGWTVEAEAMKDTREQKGGQSYHKFVWVGLTQIHIYKTANSVDSST